VDDECKHILWHQLELIGILDKVPKKVELPDSDGIKNLQHIYFYAP
jgi:hypothetical protein